MHFPRQTLRVKINQVFFEGFSLRNHLSLAIEHDTGTVEYEAVVTADLIDQRDWNFVAAGDAGQHFAAEFTFTNPEWRGGNIQNKVSARLN